MSSEVSADTAKAAPPLQHQHHQHHQQHQQHQQDSLGCMSAADRHAPPSRHLIYRDVRAFLSEVGGDPREARYWLTQFQRATATQSPAFAVLEVGRLSRSLDSKTTAVDLLGLV